MKKAGSPESYMPDPLGQFDAERAAALVDSVGEGATRKEFMAGMTGPEKEDVFIPATDPYAMVGDVIQSAQPIEEDPSFLDTARGYVRGEMKKAPLGSYIDRYLQIMEAGRNPETGGYDSEKAQAKAKELMIESGEEVYSGPSEPDPNREPGWKKALRYLTPDLDRTEALLRGMEKSDQTDEPYVPGVDIDAVTRQEAPQTGGREDSTPTEQAGTKPPPAGTKPPQESTAPAAPATTSAVRTGSGESMYDLMREIAGTKEEAKREAFANAMIQLGAGVASGDLAAGLSAAGKVASETMSNYRDRALKGKLAELQLKRTDEQMAYRNRQEALSQRREDRYSVTQANAALAKRIEEARFMVTTPALLEEKLGRKPSDKEIQDEINRQTNRIIDAVATQYGVERGLLGGMPFDIEEEEDSLTPEYQTDPSAPKLIDVN